MDRIADATREFKAHSCYWKHILAVDLEERQRGLAVQWAISCAEQLIKVRYPESFARFAADIEAAKRHYAERPDFDLVDVARAIWYRPGRDGPQTAISQLFFAIYAYHEQAPCISSTAAVISNLFTDEWPDGSEWHADSDRLFQLVLEQYKVFKERSESQ